MTQINRTALVQHPAQTLYDLVLDVGAYPRFLPWCSDGHVAEQSDSHQLATVGISKGPLKTSFTTRNELKPGEQITIHLVSGPFTRLQGSWQFRELSDSACKVELDMEFSFAAGPAGLLLKPVFTHICDTLLKAFVTRADQLAAGQS